MDSSEIKEPPILCNHARISGDDTFPDSPSFLKAEKVARDCLYFWAEKMAPIYDLDLTTFTLSHELRLNGSIRCFVASVENRSKNVEDLYQIKAARLKLDPKR